MTKVSHVQTSILCPKIQEHRIKGFLQISNVFKKEGITLLVVLIFDNLEPYGGYWSKYQYVWYGF